MTPLLQSFERLMLRRDPRRSKVYLTRTAWLSILVAAFFGAAAAILGINQFVAGWGLHPLEEPAPAIVAAPAPITATVPQGSQPLPCAATWQFIPTTPVPGMGYVGTVSDPRVIEKVQSDYLVAWNWMYTTTQPWDEAQAGWFYQGNALETVRREIARYKARGEYFKRAITGRTFTEVYFTSATQVFFGDLEQEYARIIFDAGTGKEKDRAYGGDLMMWQVSMVYDQQACRWQVIEMTEKVFKRRE